MLTGCAVGPDYKTPEPELAPFHNTKSVTARENFAVPSLERWWTGFDDPILVTIIERALAGNLDLAAVFARVSQGRALAAGASAQLLPTVSLGASAGAEHRSLRGLIGSIAGGNPGFQRNVHAVAVGPAATWEIDFFGGLQRREAASRDEAEAAEADQAGTRVIVAADAADAYLQSRGFQARLAIAEKQIATDEQLLNLVQRRYRAGAAQGLEVAQAEALLKSARATLPPLRIALEQQLNRLDVLMGAQPGTYAHELRQAAEIPGIPEIPGDAQPVDVLRRRPDIIAAERRLAASNERIGAAISNYYPKVSLTGALGIDSMSGHLFNPSALQAFGLGALRWRLFDFGKIDAEVAQARGSNAEALAIYRQAVLRAAEDVENALMRLGQTQLHVGQLHDQVQSLAKARNLSERAYRAGSITLIEVLAADRQLLAARDELYANRANAARAAVGVFRALGGGWDPPAPAPGRPRKVGGL
jgi:NodT family efflux transporter outer membrane factor (OMF) lipoprotein